MFTDFFTWESLGTFSGITLATGIVTQFFKKISNKLLKKPKVPAYWLSYITALILLVIVNIFSPNCKEIQTWIIVPLNAIAVSMASNGVYDAAARIQKNKTNLKHED